MSITRDTGTSEADRTGRQWSGINVARVGLAAVVLAWVVMAAGVAGLLVAVTLPGHAGLTPTLQSLNDALGSNPEAWMIAGGP